jgi:hypothetical protein
MHAPFLNDMKPHAGKTERKRKMKTTIIKTMLTLPKQARQMKTQK